MGLGLGKRRDESHTPTVLYVSFVGYGIDVWHLCLTVLLALLLALMFSIAVQGVRREDSRDHDHDFVSCPAGR